MNNLHFESASDYLIDLNKSLKVGDEIKYVKGGWRYTGTISSTAESSILLKEEDILLTPPYNYLFPTSRRHHLLKGTEVKITDRGREVSGIPNAFYGIKTGDDSFQIYDSLGVIINRYAILNELSISHKELRLFPYKWKHIFEEKPKMDISLIKPGAVLSLIGDDLSFTNNWYLSENNRIIILDEIASDDSVQYSDINGDEGLITHLSENLDKLKYEGEGLIKGSCFEFAGEILKVENINSRNSTIECTNLKSNYDIEYGYHFSNHNDWKFKIVPEPIFIEKEVQVKVEKVVFIDRFAAGQRVSLNPIHLDNMRTDLIRHDKESYFTIKEVLTSTYVVEYGDELRHQFSHREVIAYDTSRDNLEKPDPFSSIGKLEFTNDEGFQLINFND